MKDCGNSGFQLKSWRLYKKSSIITAKMRKTAHLFICATCLGPSYTVLILSASFAIPYANITCKKKYTFWRRTHFLTFNWRWTFLSVVKIFKCVSRSFSITIILWSYTRSFVQVSPNIDSLRGLNVVGALIQIS